MKIGYQRIYRKYNKSEFARRREEHLKLVGFAIKKFRKQKKLRNHIKLVHDSQSQKSLKTSHSKDNWSNREQVVVKV